MKRFKDKQTQNILIKFKEKLPLDEFSTQMKILFKHLSRVNWEDKKGGGDIEQATTEVFTLHKLGNHYQCSHLQWTGDQLQHKPYDGVLYFDEREQKVEISEITNQKEVKNRRQIDKERNTYRHKENPRSIVKWMKDLQCSEEGARKFVLEDKKLNDYINWNTVIVEDFIYERLTSIFEKKSKEKYKGLWLVIPYNPMFVLEYFVCDDVKKYVFEKIKKEDKFFQIFNIFKKVIFAPYEGKSLISVNLKAIHKIFELSDYV